LLAGDPPRDAAEPATQVRRRGRAPQELQRRLLQQIVGSVGADQMAREGAQRAGVLVQFSVGIGHRDAGTYPPGCQGMHDE